MIKKRIPLNTPDDCAEAARVILSDFPHQKIFAFQGPLGSGKTTLIKELCNALGVTDYTSSPSFSIINIYRTKQGEEVYHFDFYRINNLSEVYDIGYEEYFFSGKYCFIEWPEKIRELLPDDCVYIQIEHETVGDKRILLYLNKF